MQSDEPLWSLDVNLPKKWIKILNFSYSKKGSKSMIFTNSCTLVNKLQYDKIVHTTYKHRTNNLWQLPMHTAIIRKCCFSDVLEAWHFRKLTKSLLDDSVFVTSHAKIEIDHCNKEFPPVRQVDLSINTQTIEFLYNEKIMQ